MGKKTRDDDLGDWIEVTRQVFQQHQDMGVCATLLEKRVLYTLCSIGFFTQLQRIFYAKKRFNNDKKEHFWHKGSLKAIIHSYN